MIAFGVSSALATPLAVALPLAELLVAVALLPVFSAQWGALAALALLVLFVAGMANVLARGLETECHCFGQLHSSRVGRGTLARNIALVLVAAFVVLSNTRHPTPGYFEWISQLAPIQALALTFATISLALLAGIGWFMMHLLRQHGRLLLRLDALEERLASGTHSMGSADGLAVGVPAPPFTLKDLRGSTVSLDDLLAPRLPLLLVFGHPECPPCVAMLPEIASWQREHGNALGVTLISEGGLAENRALSANHGTQRVLLQPARNIAEEYEAYGTPSAVLVSPDGLIASAVAQGAPAIRAVVDSVLRVTPPAAAREAHRGGNGAAQWHDEPTVTLQAVSLDAS